MRSGKGARSCSVTSGAASVAPANNAWRSRSNCERKLEGRSSRAARSSGTTRIPLAMVPTFASPQAVTIIAWDSSTPGSAGYHHHGARTASPTAAATSSTAAASHKNPAAGEIDARSWLISAHRKALAAPSRWIRPWSPMKIASARVITAPPLG